MIANTPQTQPVDDTARELLMQCINSGQVEPDQLVQHFLAGELNDDKEQP